MSGYVNKLRKLYPRADVSKSGQTEQKTDLPLDHRLAFVPAFDEKWTFDEERKICLNGIDVKEVMAEGGNNIGVLCGLFQGLSDYQGHVWKKGGRCFEKFNGVVDSLKSAVQHKLGNIYDNLTGGICFEFSEDEFWINNINVRSVLSLYRIKPTEKARRYLSGLHDKLGLILSHRQSSSRYDGVSDRAQGLYDEISLALEYLPPDAPLRLTDGSRLA